MSTEEEKETDGHKDEEREAELYSHIRLLMPGRPFHSAALPVM